MGTKLCVNVYLNESPNVTLKYLTTADSQTTIALFQHQSKWSFTACTWHARHYGNIIQLHTVKCPQNEMEWTLSKDNHLGRWSERGGAEKGVGLLLFGKANCPFSCFATRTSSWKIKILPSPVGRTVESRFRREYCLEQLTVQSLTLNEIKQYSTRPIDCVLSLRIPPFWSDRTGFILIISRFLIGWTVGGPLRRQYTSLCC